MDSTVCAIFMNRMKEFFENYSAGGIENVDDIDFMESDHDRSCAKVNGVITGMGGTENGCTRIFIGWYYGVFSLRKHVKDEKTC